MTAIFGLGMDILGIEVEELTEGDVAEDAVGSRATVTGAGTTGSVVGAEVGALVGTAELVDDGGRVLSLDMQEQLDPIRNT